MIRKLGLVGAVGALALAVAGCDDDSVPRISGTAAMGAPIHLGEVRAEGANGVMSAIDVTDSHGRFSIRSIGMTAPIVVRIRNGKYDHDNNPLTLPSSAPAQMVVLHTTSSGNVNLTPLSTLALQQATGVSARTELYGVLTNPATVPTADEIAEAAAIVRANLASVASANGITNWTDYDIFRDPFSADGTGFDAILDAVTCSASGSTETVDFSVTCSGAVSSFDPNIDISGYYEPGSTGGGGGGGTLAIPPASTWDYMVSGTVMDSVAGSEVPSTPTLANEVGSAFAAASATYSGEGITVTVTGLNVTFSHTGDGSSIGDTVTAHVTATTNMTGVPVVGNASVPVDSTLKWVRTN